MGWTPEVRLRMMLGDQLPDGGTPDVDTHFTDADIQNLLDGNGGNIVRAAYEGWQMWAAYYAQMVTVSEGNAIRQMSDLQAHAIAMAKQYDGAGNSMTAGRTRVGRIRRPYA